MQLSDPASDYSRLCAEARVSLETGDYAQAAQTARRALGVLPRGLEAWRLLGLAQLETGEVRPALNALQTVLACDPYDLVALAGVAEAQERIGGPASAELDWQRVWEADPGIEAAEHRLRTARQDPARPSLTRPALARVYLRGGLFDLAVSEARAALAGDPNRLDLLVLVAEAYWRAGDDQTAAAFASTILERHPDCVAAGLLVAAHWQSIGKDAGPLVARARAIDPEGIVAARLFDDRLPPPLFEPEATQWDRERTASGAWPAVPAATTPAGPAAPAVGAATIVRLPLDMPARDVPVPEVPAPDVPARDLTERARHEEPVAAVSKAEAGQPSYVGDWIGGPPGAAAGPAQVEPERTGFGTLDPGPGAGWPIVLPPARTPEAPIPATALPGIAEAPALARVEAPAPIEEQVAAEAPMAAASPVTPTAPAAVVEAGAPVTADTPSALRAAGDAAMRGRRYFDALRIYGAWLRRLRAIDEASSSAKTAG